MNGSDKLLAIGRQRGLAKGRENALAIGRTCAAQGLYCRCSSLKFMSKGFANVFTAIASNQGVGIRAVNRNCKQNCRVKKISDEKEIDGNFTFNKDLVATRCFYKKLTAMIFFVSQKPVLVYLKIPHLSILLSSLTLL